MTQRHLKLPTKLMAYGPVNTINRTSMIHDNHYPLGYSRCSPVMPAAVLRLLLVVAAVGSNIFCTQCRKLFLTPPWQKNYGYGKAVHLISHEKCPFPDLLKDGWLIESSLFPGSNEPCITTECTPPQYQSTRSFPWLRWPSVEKWHPKKSKALSLSLPCPFSISS